jgi:hypothetical protein
VPRLFSVLVGVATLAIIVQAVTAGLFVDRRGSDAWVTVHGAIADVTWVTALALAIVAYRTIRATHHRLWLGSALLFVLTLAQTGIGHLITDQGVDWLLVVHIPLALAIFGLTIWLATTVSWRRRTALEPYVDEPSAGPRRHSLSVSYRD